MWVSNLSMGLVDLEWLYFRAYRIRSMQASERIVLGLRDARYPTHMFFLGALQSGLVYNECGTHSRDIMKLYFVTLPVALILERQLLKMPPACTLRFEHRVAENAPDGATLISQVTSYYPTAISRRQMLRIIYLVYRSRYTRSTQPKRRRNA